MQTHVPSGRPHVLIITHIKMENPYIKQFPDLFRDKTIMYNHGFGSSAASGTVRLIQQTFPRARVVAFDLPLHPEEAMALLREKVDQLRPHLVIGTSMGGMYTEMLTGVDRICVNPAFEMGQTMKDHGMTGKQSWQNPRQDGQTDFIVTKALEKEYREMTEQCFLALEAMTPEQQAEERRRVWGLFGDEDEVVHTFDLYHSHYPQAARFHGGHRMDDRSFMNGVVPVMRWIDDRQEGRERRVVYIDGSTLRDGYGKPKASLAKAYQMLIEHYAVYIVFAAPTNDPGRLRDDAAWVEQYLSTPAHDHVIFTNEKPLLYGDYLIDSSACDDFMGTVVRLGSDEMKTWEEVITYFDRLGGQ